MKLEHLHRDVNDLLISAVRSRTVEQGVVLYDPLHLGEAWLRGAENTWLRDHSQLMQQDENPTLKAAEGLEPFSTGSFISSRQRSTAVIGLMPAFISPRMERGTSGIATTMPGFGPLGQFRFTAYHEMGHYLENELRLHTGSTELKRQHRSECRADGFAIAAAVAQGADPKACLEDVGAFRAATSVENGIPAGYFTFPVLEAAAEIGLQARGKPIQPFAMMDQLDWAVARHGLPTDLLEEMNEKSHHDLRKRAEFSDVVRPMDKFLEKQPTWTLEQEKHWQQQMLLHNPKEAPVLQRMPGAILLAQLTSHPMQKMMETVPAMHAGFVLERLKRAAGDDRLAALEACHPKGASCSDHAEAFYKASKIFTQDHDVVLQKHLKTLSEMTQRSTTPPIPAIHHVNKGLDQPVQSMVLVDERGLGIKDDNFSTMVDKISAAQKTVKVLCVVGNTQEHAQDRANFIRRVSDNMKMTLYPIDTQRLQQKKDDIAKSIQQGKVWAIGDLPELQQERIAYKPKNHAR